MNKDELLVKYWAGLLSHENMANNPKWLEAWTETAKTAELDNMELVVFRIPKQTNGNAEYADIEQFLQEKYGK